MFKPFISSYIGLKIDLENEKLNSEYPCIRNMAVCGFSYNARAACCCCT